MKKSLGDTVGVTVFGLLAMAAAPALAQDRPDDEGAANGEIIVTAQKREQKLIDVPISITAVTGEVLAKRGASALEDAQFSVPGLAITQFAPGQQRVNLRGVSAYSGLPTVGVYLDEIPLNMEAGQSGQDVRLLDINRIEVLRGPQGTLYGQGAVSGTIRYITNEVDLDHLSASATGEVAGVSSGGTDWKGEAVVNVPIVTDQLGARFAGSYQNFGGWIDNPVLGLRNVNSGHALTLRGKLATVLGERFKLGITVQHQELEIGAQNLSTSDQKVFDQLPTPYTSKVTLANALATYDFGSVTLLSSTSLLRRNNHQILDLTATFLPFLPFFGVPPGAVSSIGLKGDSSSEIFSQEVRLSSNGDNLLNWTIGGFYRDSRGSQNGIDIQNPVVLPPGLLLSVSGTSPENSKSFAAFGEASYQIMPTLNLLVGLRYFEDKRTQHSVSSIFGNAAVDNGKGKFHALSPRFNLSWQPNRNINVYANVGKGFRSGGFNLTSTGFGNPVQPSFKPDTLWSYEVGGKFQTDDRKLSLEVAGYRNEWSDVQVTTNYPGLPNNFTTNGGKLTGWGVDGSVTYLPISAVTLTLTGGWNDMAYRSNTLDHLAGDPADYVPRFTGSVSAEYRFDLGTLPSFARVDYQYSDKFQVYIRNFQAAPVFSDTQSILNARIGASGENWSASIFVRNILNRDSVLYPAFASLIYPARQQPRTIGASFNVKY
ncbi:TonB-dependent receptor [Aquisediminimonas profunda]|uniref:TonB-dependent receptor n=1 Tax=Aquisediminimonas profunda TaxID=1550733 RepID=UPI001C62917B|nr:TonB-dependent receptor [Aquisediminimonas profunda]